MMTLTLLMAATQASANTWILDETLMVQVRPPVPVGWVESRTVARWLVDWQPGQSQFSAQLCHIHIDPVLGAQTTWPEATKAAVPTLVRPVSFDGASFNAGPVTETLGATDADGDGHPGVTIRVDHPRAGQGEVYIRQTATLQWEGQQDPDGVIRGVVRYEPEQTLLGASTWWLRLGLSQRAHRNAASTFALTPTSAMSCAD